jgi:hypothetical protein
MATFVDNVSCINHEWIRVRGNSRDGEILCIFCIIEARATVNNRIADVRISVSRDATTRELRKSQHLLFSLFRSERGDAKERKCEGISLDASYLQCGRADGGLDNCAR